MFLSMLLGDSEFATENPEKGELGRTDGEFCISYMICPIYRYSIVLAWLKRP